MKKIFGILAHPAKHSLSPVMHNAGMKNLGINGEFKFFDIPPQELAKFFQKIRTEKVQGLAVSIPHKEKVSPYLDKITEKAKKIGAINTIYWENEKLCGTNTDEIGFLRALEGLSPKTALVLGAGGASRAVLYALQNQKIKTKIWARKKEQAEKLAQEFKAEAIEKPNQKLELIINCTPVGMSPNTENSILPANFWQAHHIAYDLVMNPRKTRFIKEAEKAGAKIITGEKMLLFQGIEQFKIWHKQEAPQDIMQKTLKNNLD